MTMESVASRAGTNKSVLYRRWGDKSELVITAMRKYLPKIANDVSDTGSLRNDVYAYLHGLMEPLKLIGAQTIRGLIMEPVVWRTIIAAVPQVIEQRLEEKKEDKVTLALTAILKNAELRGEVRFEKLTPRIISLPMNLMLCEVITKLEPVSDEVIAEIVDDIFMPLIRETQP
jgi:AcrR family transcriptional regulator